MVLGSDLLAADFPHGTVAGYDRGCKGSQAVCGAVIPCRDVKRRYGSDLDFRRLIDNGVPLDQIVALDQAASAHDQAVEAARRKGQPDPAPLTLDAADAVAARRPVPTVPSIKPGELVKPVPDVDDEGRVLESAVALHTEESTDLGLPAEAIAAPERPRKWAVRKVWVAIAPDGSLHGPFDGDAQARVYVSAQFPAPVTVPAVEAPQAVTAASSDEAEEAPAANAEAVGKRTYQRWTEEHDARAKRLWQQGLLDSAIAKAMGRTQGTVSAKLRALGLAPNKKNPAA